MTWNLPKVSVLVNQRKVIKILWSRPFAIEFGSFISVVYSAMIFRVQKVIPAHRVHFSGLDVVFKCYCFCLFLMLICCDNLKRHLEVICGMNGFEDCPLFLVKYNQKLPGESEKTWGV